MHPNLLAKRDVGYLTELDAFHTVASCVQEALVTAVQSKTVDDCPENPSGLQSCVCKTASDDAASTSLASLISFNCGGRGADEQLSTAHLVLDYYCHLDPSAKPTSLLLPTPTGSSVTMALTQVPEYANLPSCLQEGMSSVVSSMTLSYCPTDVNGFADCVCRSRESAVVTSRLQSDIAATCSNSEDASSAQDFFAAYCDQVSGTTAFPTPSDPPGDMTYYITAMPQYTSIPGCAQIAYSDVFQTLETYCASGPKALASCLCIKNDMYRRMYTTLYDHISDSCRSSDFGEVSSAMSPYGIYCSAAKGDTVLAGITESVEQTYVTGTLETSPATRTSGANDLYTSGVYNKGTPLGAILGGVLGGIAALLLIGLGIWFYRKHRRAVARRVLEATVTTTGGGHGGTGFGKAENPFVDPTPGPMGRAEIQGNPIGDSTTLATNPSPLISAFTATTTSMHSSSNPVLTPPPPVPPFDATAAYARHMTPSELHSIYQPMPSELPPAGERSAHAPTGNVFEAPSEPFSSSAAQQSQPYGGYQYQFPAGPIAYEYEMTNVRRE